MPGATIAGQRVPTVSPAAMRLRCETPADADAIDALLARAFAGHPHSHQTEAAIVRALRAAGALSLSLVAEDDDGGVIGHVAASPVRVAGAERGWYGLGPLAVEPARQRGGVGSALMRAVLETRGAAGCVLVGDPAYYARFGFAPLPGLELPGVPAEVFVGRVLAGPPAHGLVAFHPAFEAS